MARQKRGRKDLLFSLLEEGSTKERASRGKGKRILPKSPRRPVRCPAAGVVLEEEMSNVRGKRKRPSHMLKTDSPTTSTENSSAEDRGIMRQPRIVVTRCSMQAYGQARKSLQFRKVHEDLLRTTPFSHYLNCEIIAFDRFLLEDVISCHVENDMFLIGGQSLRFSPEDLALILGVPCIGKRIDHYGTAIHTSRLHSRFGKNFAFTKTSVCGKIRELLDFPDDKNAEDIVRLWIVLMLCTFLSPRSSHSCQPQLLHYLDDLDAIRSYSWVVAFHETIMHNFDAVSKFVKNIRGGKKTVAKRKTADADRQAYTVICDCSVALCVWFLEHTQLRPTQDMSKFPRLLMWKLRMRRKSDPAVASLKPSQVILQMQVHSSEKLLLEESTSKIGGEDVEDKRDKTYDELANEVKALVEAVRISEEERKKDAIAFNASIQAMLKQVQEFMSQVELVKGSPTMMMDETIVGDVENGGKEPTMMMDERIVGEDENGGKASQGPSSIAKTVKNREDRCPSWYQMSPFEQFFGRKRRSSRRVPHKSGKTIPDQKPYVRIDQPIDVSDADDVATHVKKAYLQNRRDFCGQGQLDASDEALINEFLSSEINDNEVLKNQWNGWVTRFHLDDLLFGEMTEDDVIDTCAHLLKEKQTSTPMEYHDWGYGATCSTALILKVKEPIFRKARMLMNAFPEFTHSDVLGNISYIFFVLHTSNHWHLLAVDLRKKCFTSYNPIKGSPLYNADARHWVLVLQNFFEMTSTIPECKSWELYFDNESPSQPPESLDCALYCIKYIECLSRKVDAISWDFGDNDMPRFRGQLAADILHAGKRLAS